MERDGLTGERGVVVDISCFGEKNTFIVVAEK
jgi:hypothetical protein